MTSQTLRMRFLPAIPGSNASASQAAAAASATLAQTSAAAAAISATAAAASAASAAGGSGSIRTVTAAGDVTVVASDVIILMNKTVGAPTNINLPTSASRLGVPVIVKDYKGDANTNNITFVPNGAETIDGFSGAAAITNGSAVINSNYGKKTLYPLLSGGWYL